MPKKKRTYTPEQLERARENLAKARAARKLNQEKAAYDPTAPAEPAFSVVEGTPVLPEEATTGGEGIPVPAPEPTKETVVPEQSTEAILARALEAIEALAKIQAGNAAPAASAYAPTNKTVTKFSINPKDYPDPVVRLTAEPKLAQFAFPVNYELKYDVRSTQYQAKDGTNYIEPQFHLELVQIVRNPSTGEDNGKRYVVGRMLMHEDPQAALVVARENGVDIDQYAEKAFLDEMRYLQFRDWVFESFFTPISTNHANMSEEVVGGRLVQFYETNNQEAQRLPFEKISLKG